MAYIINKYNGDQAALVEDGTINTTLDIKLIGKNYAGYGEAQNENYTWLLENFASQTAPPKAVVGQLWYQTSTQKLKVNYGTGVWHTVGINDVVSSVSDITGLTQGDLFWVSDEQQLWCKGSTENILIGGKLTNISTQMRSTTVLSNTNPAVPYEIIEAVVNGVTTYVISSAAAMFTLATSEPLRSAGFSSIYPGITVSGFSATGNLSDTYKYWGSASNSDRLGGTLASGYVTKSGATFSDLAKFAETGFSLGTSGSDILSVTTPSSVPTITSTVNSIVFKTKVSNTIKQPMTLEGQDILPGTPYASSAGSNIGSLTSKFYQVYATEFKGNSDSASALTLSSVSYAPAIDASSGTAVLRAPTGGTSITVNGVSYTLPEGGIAATQVVAPDLKGNASSATGLLINTATVLPSTAATANTVVVRTAVDDNTVTVNGSLVTLKAGSIRVVQLYASNGVGTLLGDLAEKYLADDVYETGTVIMVGGDKEITAAISGNRALGVVSENPAYLMNIGLKDGTAVALKGRVPVKVTGTVKKGDRLVASAIAGVATALTNSNESEFVFAISLTNDNNNTVEAIII